MTISRLVIDLLDRCIDACTEMRDSLIAHDSTIPQDDPDERLYVPTAKALAAFPPHVCRGATRAQLAPAPSEAGRKI